MRTFMAVSQAVRDTLLMFVCAAMFFLNGCAQWLVDEETLRRFKEKHDE